MTLLAVVRCWRAIFPAAARTLLSKSIVVRMVTSVVCRNRVLYSPSRRSALSLARFDQPYRCYLHRDFVRAELLSGVLGPRGVGKGTLLLQFIGDTPDFLRSALYVSLDSIHAIGVQLYALADQFRKQGGRLLVLDEIHHYADFERELKSIHDAFDLQVVFSGSSALHLEHSKADFSRRAVMYAMSGLSFREYLELQTGEAFAVWPLEQVLAEHERLSLEINRRIRPLAHFGDYLKHGYFPYFRESVETYHRKLEQTLAAAIGSMRSTTTPICTTWSRRPSLRSVWGAGRNASMLSKPEKLSLANTNNA